MLQIALQTVSMVYNVPFQRLLEAVEQSSGNNRKGLPAVVCDATYNNSFIVKRSNCEYHRLSLQGMSTFVELNSSLIDLGAHGPLNCFELHFKTWYAVLVRDVEKVLKHERVLEFEDPVT